MVNNVHLRYYLEIEGRRRLRLESSSDLDGYRLAKARPMTDEPEPEAPAAAEDGEVSEASDDG